MDVSSMGLDALLGKYGVNASRASGDLNAATERLIQSKDQDGNGTLNAVEIFISEEGFKLADANADGELDAGELKNAVGTISAELKPQGPGGPPTQQSGEDDDEEDAETSSLLATLFQQADTNQDGVLSNDELLAAGEMIGPELRPERAPSRRSIEDLFQSPSDDDAQTNLNQIA
jgi:Ca2+-binding EF-hand superfamily protein